MAVSLTAGAMSSRCGKPLQDADNHRRVHRECARRFTPGLQPDQSLRNVFLHKALGVDRRIRYS